VPGIPHDRHPATIGTRSTEALMHPGHPRHARHPWPEAPRAYQYNFSPNWTVRQRIRQPLRVVERVDQIGAGLEPPVAVWLIVRDCINPPAPRIGAARPNVDWNRA